MSTPSSPLCIQSIFTGQINENSLSIPLEIRLENRIVETLSLLDSEPEANSLTRIMPKL